MLLEAGWATVNWKHKHIQLNISNKSIRSLVTLVNRTWTGPCLLCVIVFSENTQVTGLLWLAFLFGVLLTLMDGKLEI